ncbi:hypothetical protein HK100_000718 [Physocladia obscura]|uniref:CAP-Gly domain-containing protein n=1 Tax=Physocladia obscura TaxID=109957 RepID=A0AAD5SY91_9FUNG|nr:hypothetical protein HK100_000718 [Physocladia obscura]
MNKAKVGDRVAVDRKSRKDWGIVQFVGTTDFGIGEWIGVELDQSEAGNNDGSTSTVTTTVVDSSVRHPRVVLDTRLLTSTLTIASQPNLPVSSTSAATSTRTRTQNSAAVSLAHAILPTDRSKAAKLPVATKPKNFQDSKSTVKPNKQTVTEPRPGSETVVIKIRSCLPGNEDRIYRFNLPKIVSLEAFKDAVQKKVKNSLKIKSLTFNDNGDIVYIEDNDDFFLAQSAPQIIVHWKTAATNFSPIASDAVLSTTTKFLTDEPSKAAYDPPKSWELVLFQDWKCHGGNDDHDWFVR